MKNQIKTELRATNVKELWEAFRDNYLYGFLSLSGMTFVKLGNDWGIIVSFFFFYLFLSKIVNRPKYITLIGKFIFFPVPCTLGAYSGYRFGTYITQLL